MNNIQTDAFIYALRNKKLKATQVTDILKNLASQAKDSETYDNLVKLYSYENNFHQPFLFELGNKRSAVIMPRRCEAW
jgi:hypothetical protein